MYRIKLFINLFFKALKTITIRVLFYMLWQKIEHSSTIYFWTEVSDIVSTKRTWRFILNQELTPCTLWFALNESKIFNAYGHNPKIYKLGNVRIISFLNHSSHLVLLDTPTVQCIIRFWAIHFLCKFVDIAQKQYRNQS